MPLPSPNYLYFTSPLLDLHASPLSLVGTSPNTTSLFSKYWPSWLPYATKSLEKNFLIQTTKLKDLGLLFYIFSKLVNFFLRIANIKVKLTKYCLGFCSFKQNIRLILKNKNKCKSKLCRINVVNTIFLAHCPPIHRLQKWISLQI